MEDPEIISGWPETPLIGQLDGAEKLLTQGDIGAARATFQAVERRALAERHFPAALRASAALATLAYAEGHEEAKILALRAFDLAKEIGEVRIEADLLVLLAHIAFDDGRSKDGHDHLLDAMAAYSDLGETAEIPRLIRWYAEHLAFLGATKEADAALVLAEARYREINDESGAIACALDRKAITERASSV